MHRSKSRCGTMFSSRFCTKVHIWFQVSLKLLAVAEAIPVLNGVGETCGLAAKFAQSDVENAIANWWTQPAVHAVPWVKCKPDLFFILLAFSAATPHVCKAVGGVRIMSHARRLS